MNDRTIAWTLGLATILAALGIAAVHLAGQGSLDGWVAGAWLGVLILVWVTRLGRHA